MDESIITIILATLLVGTFIGCLCIYCVMKCATRKTNNRLTLGAQAAAGASQR